jgi:hypothetical protein
MLQPKAAASANALEDHPFIARLRPDILPPISDILSGFQPEVFIEHA